MTNNNLTDERLSVLIRVARDSLELYEMELPVIDDVMLALAELQIRRAAMLQGVENAESPTTMHPAPALDSSPKIAESPSGNSPVIPDAYDIEAFGIFSATEGENGMMMEVDRFHFETDSCPQIGKDKFVPKFAIQAIINRLQKHCDNMEPDALVNAMSASAAPQQEVKP